MPSYKRRVEVPGKTSDELYAKISEDIDKLMEKISLGNFEVFREPSKKEVSLKSSMVTATLRCEEGAVSLDASLSLAASLFRSKIDGGIDRWLAKTFPT